MAATTKDKPSAADLRAAKEAREAAEEAKVADARASAEREQTEAERVAERERAASQNGHGRGVDAQDGLFDTVIENDELEESLEDREKVKASRAALNAKFKEADDKVKGIIALLELEKDATIRVGRFRITLASVGAKSVAFETEPTERLTISVLDS